MRWIGCWHLWRRLGKNIRCWLIAKMLVDYGLMKTTKANLLNLYDIDTIWACHVFCPCWNSLMLWWSLHKAHMYLYVITLQLSKFTNQTYTWCMVIQTQTSKLQTFQSSLMLLETHHVGSHMIGLLISMMAHRTWLFKFWDILTWSILLIPHWSPLSNYSQWLWNIYHIYESPMHCCMWFVGYWVGTHVFKSWINECWRHFPTILARTKLWVHFLNSFELDQKTLLYTQETWNIWFMGSWTTFKRYFWSTYTPFQVDHENPTIKLWHQLATNNLLVVHHFKFMKLVQITIDQVIGGVEDERTFLTPTFMESKFQL